MNIFVTNSDPVLSAQVLDDKRVVKMVLESAQLLSTAMNLTSGLTIAPLKTTHKNHPSTIWTMESRGNYIWLLEHFEALLEEYTKRYSKTHKYNDLVNDFEYGITFIPQGELKPFAKVVSSDILEEDVFLAYKKALYLKWQNDKRVPRWNKIEKTEEDIIKMLDEV